MLSLWQRQTKASNAVKVNANEKHRITRPGLIFWNATGQARLYRTPGTPADGPYRHQSTPSELSTSRSCSSPSKHASHTLTIRHCTLGSAQSKPYRHVSCHERRTHSKYAGKWPDRMPGSLSFWKMPHNDVDASVSDGHQTTINN